VVRRCRLWLSLNRLLYLPRPESRPAGAVPPTNAAAFCGRTCPPIRANQALDSTGSRPNRTANSAGLTGRSRAERAYPPGGARKLDIARELGANVVVDYAKPDWPDGVRHEVGRLDVVFDGVGGAVGRAAFDLLRPAGRFLPLGMSSGAFAPVDSAQAGRRQIRLDPPRPTNARRDARSCRRLWPRRRPDVWAR
jgi:Zinc-binding dehydrogenase